MIGGLVGGWSRISHPSQEFLSTVHQVGQSDIVEVDLVYSNLWMRK